MEKRGIWFLAFCCVCLIFAFGVFGEINYAGNEVWKNYVGGGVVSGYMNLSFSNEPYNSLFTSNFKGNITLIGLLRKNNVTQGIDYNCTNEGCGDDFAINGSVGNIVLNSGVPVFVGFKLTGNSVSLESLEFSVRGNNSASCVRDFFIDFLDNKTYYIHNNKYTDNLCPAEYGGCFNGNLGGGDYQYAEITNTEYCEKIGLPPSPSYLIGANLKNSTKGVSTLSMSLYDNGKSFIAKCNLPIQKEDIERVMCQLNYSSLENSSYYVCIKSSSSFSGYKILFESSGDVCGTDSLGNNILDKDYEIFAKAKQFALLDMKVDNNLFSSLNGIELTGLVNEYLGDVYGNKCSPYCVIPLKVSGNGQTVQFSNAEIKYYSGNTLLSSNNLYLLSKGNASISSKTMRLNLGGAGFEIPVDSDEDRFELYFKGNRVFSSDININESFDFDITPRFSLIGSETEFRAITSEKIVSGFWDFGDGSVKSTNGTNSTHKYMDEGDYEMKIKLTNKYGDIAYKTFSIQVGDAKASAEQLFDIYDSRLNILEQNLNQIPEWIRKEIEKRTDIFNIKASIIKLKNDFNASSTNDSYARVVENLLSFNVPGKIAISDKAVFPIELGLGKVDISYLEEISAKEIKDKEGFMQQLANWMKDNYDAKVERVIYSAFNEKEKKELLSVFEIDAKSKNDSGNVYLIINYPLSSISFKEGYGERSVKGGVYVGFDGSKKISFFVPSRVGMADLGIYISPDAGKIGVVGDKIEEQDEYLWVWVCLMVVVLLIVLLVVYIILQEWYKRHYESYLFKNKNDLYNILTFIHNSRKQELGDGEIVQRLKGSKWSSEQITYALKKIDGKRTGMWEIPIFSFYEKRQIRKEIENRNLGREEFNANAKFIKRPSF